MDSNIAFQWGDVATWAAVIVAALALIVSIVSARISIQAQRDARVASEKSLKIATHTWEDQYFSGMRVWAEEVVHAISVANHAVKDASAKNRDPLFNELPSQISALLDRGRWFFPNEYQDEYGREKPRAYRGLRLPILDCIHRVYQLLVGEIRSSDLSRELFRLQCEFVSHVQEELDPRKREQAAQDIRAMFAGVDRMPGVPK